MQARVAHVEQRLPVLRSARCGRERRILAQSRFHQRGIAENQRCLQRGRRQVGIQGEEPVRASRRAAGRAPEEFLDGCRERQGPCFDFFA